MASVAMNKVIVQVLHISYDTASEIHFAAIYAKCMYCSLDVYKYYNTKVTVEFVNDTHRDKIQLPYWPKA